MRGSRSRSGSATFRCPHGDTFSEYDRPYGGCSLKSCLRTSPVPTKCDRRRKFLVSCRMRPAMIAGLMPSC